MQAESLDSLRTLREQVASLRVIRCRMLHERVRVEDGAALRVARGEPEPSLVRIGLCSPEVRARNLACGHTMARYVLLDAVQALHAAGSLPDAAHKPLRETLEGACNAIHLLDHRKGDAERRLALSSEMVHRSRGGAAEEEETSAAERSAAEVRRLEEQHDAFAEQIREIRGAVLAHLDAAIIGGGVREALS